MANEGIFITKSGVSLPAVTEMTTSNLSGYQSNLNLPLVKNTDHEFSVFEFFKFRGYIDEAVNATFVFNGKTNYTPNFLAGSGSVNSTTGLVTQTTNPIQIEEANKVFLQGATFRGEQVASGDDVNVRIASIDGLSRILVEIDTGAITVHQNNVSVDTDVFVFTEPAAAIFTINDDAIVVTDQLAATVYSLPRTFVAAVASGAIGVMASSGLATGDALPFDQTETFQSADSVVTGTITITSNFGQTTTYAVTLGEALNTSESSAMPISFTAGQSGTYATTDDFSGGVGTKTYALSSGALPSGMNLTGAGVIQGTPVTDGTSTVVVRVTDAVGAEINLEYLITVTQSANVSYEPKPAVEDVAYSYAPKLAGLTGVAVTQGAIPDGLSLDLNTAALTGTPTLAGVYSYSLQFTFDDATEIVDIIHTVYGTMSSELFADNVSEGVMVTGESRQVNQADQLNIQMAGGSGQYQYSITGENFINSNGDIELYQTGSVTVTIIDIVTGQEIVVELIVAGQTDICGMVVEEDEESQNDTAPCVDVLTDCETPVTIAFNTLQLLKGVAVGDTVYREYPMFEFMEGATVQNNGKAFVTFRSSAVGGFAVANNAHDGKPFIAEFALNATVANSAADFHIGIAKNFNASMGVAGLKFAVVVTTVGGVRSVEIRKDNIYQGSSRFPILEGQQIGFAVFADSIQLYIDGISVYQTTSNTFLCSGMDIVFFAEAANLLCGGRATNIVYNIATAGTPDEVGTVDYTGGLYTPSLNNVPMVRVIGYSTATEGVIYQANVRIIKSAMKTSLEGAMIEGVPVDIWIMDDDRKDELPARLDRDGRPDKNQFTNPEHLGTLVGSGKITATPTRQDFRNDRGATSTSLVIDRVTLTGGFLAVRNQSLVKRLVPFMKQSNSHGVRQLKQYSSGCHQKYRMLMVWQAAACDDVPIFDAIELHNALSYTMFDLEIGQAIQSQLPITIEGFPNKDGVIFDYNQYDKHFNRIGS